MYCLAVLLQVNVTGSSWFPVWWLMCSKDFKFRYIYQFVIEHGLVGKLLGNNKIFFLTVEY